MISSLFDPRDFEENRRLLSSSSSNLGAMVSKNCYLTTSRQFNKIPIIFGTFEKHFNLLVTDDFLLSWRCFGSDDFPLQIGCIFRFLAITPLKSNIIATQNSHA